MNPVEHQPEKHRFASTEDGMTSLIEYRIDGSVMTLTHTEVAPELQGHGVGAALVDAAVAHAEANQLEVNPVCSYARAHLQRKGAKTAGG